MAARADPRLDPNDPLTILVSASLVKNFKPVYTYIIVTCIWSAMLVPLFVVLVFFSNRELRRKPVFIGNVFAISIGISFSGVLLGLTVPVLRDPLAPSPKIPLFLTILAGYFALGPIIVESVLLLRLWAVYPFKTTPRKIFLAIYIPIVLLKIARVTNAIMYLVNISTQIDNGADVFLSLQETWRTFPHFKIGWSLQVTDNTFTSALFLSKLNKGRSLRSRSVVSRGRLASTLDQLFWIAVYNFVIPVILNITALIVICSTNDIFQIVPICIVNLYEEIIGVLLATVWAAGERWKDTHTSTSSGVQVLTTVIVDGGVDMSAITGNKAEQKK